MYTYEADIVAKSGSFEIFMLKRFQQGHRLLYQTLIIINNHKKLLLLPVISTLLSVLLFVLIMIPLLPYTKLQGHLTSEQWIHFLWWYLAFLITLFILDLIYQLFKAALTICISDYFLGYEVSLLHGIKQTFKKFGSIFLWAIYSSTVGNVIYIFQGFLKDQPWVQRLLDHLLWAIGIYFVIPIIMLENKGPVKSLKRSTQLICATWGSPVVGNFGYYFWFFILRILAFIPIIAAWIHGGTHAIVIGSTISTILFTAITAFHIYSKVIILTAMYYFAVEKKAYPPFQLESLQHAFVIWRKKP